MCWRWLAPRVPPREQPTMVLLAVGSPCGRRRIVILSDGGHLHRVCGLRDSCRYVTHLPISSNWLLVCHSWPPFPCWCIALKVEPIKKIGWGQIYTLIFVMSCHVSMKYVTSCVDLVTYRTLVPLSLCLPPNQTVITSWYCIRWNMCGCMEVYQAHMMHKIALLTIAGLALNTLMSVQWKLIFLLPGQICIPESLALATLVGFLFPGKVLLWTGDFLLGTRLGVTMSNICWINIGALRLVFPRRSLRMRLLLFGVACGMLMC